jgi:hypothetical protein
MSASSLADEVHALAIADALRRIAPGEVGLADSLSFCRRLDGISPTAPGFDSAVSAAVHATRWPTQAERAAEQAQRAAAQRAAEETAAAARRAHGQWTEQDAQNAPLDELTVAYHNGQLANVIGVPPRRPERRTVTRPRMPSPAQVARWRQMQPWQARRERAAWLRGGESA